MPKIIPPLTKLRCDALRYSADGANRLFDGGGLYLEAFPTGSKLWRLKYSIDGKAKLLALGKYPAVSLAAAREGREAARQLIASGIDPIAQRKAGKQKASMDAVNTFETIAREWFAKFSTTWAESYSSKVLLRLEKHVFPWIGSKPIAEVSAPDILAILARLENAGTLETAHKLRGVLSRIFLYAIATARAENDPAHAVRGSLAPAEKRNFPTITDPEAIGALMRAIDGYQGQYVTRCALALAPLFFVRPGELRQAQWDEFDFSEAVWRVPAQRLKMRITAKAKHPPHIVPLSRQALAILDDLHHLTGRGKFVFPGNRSPMTRPMSDNTINAALRRMGYGKTEIVGHGFRHMASTLLHEMGFTHEAIECQLSHKKKGVSAVYNKAEYLPERRKIMQHWADYLEALKYNRPLPAAPIAGQS